MNPDEINSKVFSLVRRGYDPTEVDEFLERCAAALSQAQGGLAEPSTSAPEAEPSTAAPPAEPPSTPATAVTGPDDFGPFAEEVAAILRQAHESVARLRHGAEADAALIRQTAQREADELRAEADRDRQQAAVELEAARDEANRIADSAGELAQRRVDEVIERAKIDARGAVGVQRNIRSRLEGVQGDVAAAVDRLVQEDTELFATIDLTDDTLAQEGEAVLSVDDGLAPPPGQGPPSPPVPPPPVARASDPLDLPYATDDEDEPADDGPDEEPPGGLGSIPPPPPPYTGDDDTAAEVPEAPGPTTEDADEDALAQMVKNAVENALRRRKGDADPTNGNGA
jgi:DivIVA domain-containing protein